MTTKTGQPSLDMFWARVNEKLAALGEKEALWGEINWRFRDTQTSAQAVFEIIEERKFQREIEMTTTYSNPRMSATIENWPSGSKRVTAQFAIETDPKRGERGVRTTTGAPKKLTYARRARIVDGDDGRTYIAELNLYGHVSIMCGDFKYEHESIHDSDARYPMAVALFDR